MDKDIDSIIAELKAEEIPAQHKEIITNNNPQNLSDETVGEYVYKKSTELVESTLDAINNLKDVVITGNDPKEISALSQLINSATKALDQLNKINLQNKQNINTLEVKKLELESSSNLSKLNSPTTNIVIATRDEILDKISNGNSKRERIQIVDSQITE
jgi:hypothetical protein